MTGLEAQGKLIEYFSEKHSITTNQVIGLIPDKVDKIEGETAFLSCLNDLTESNFLFKREIQDGEKKYTMWLLKKPLSFFEQTVSLDGMIATGIAQIVNSFADVSKNPDVTCNPLNIRPQDIAVLMEIIGLYSKQAEEQMVKEEKQSKGKAKS